MSKSFIMSVKTFRVRGKFKRSRKTQGFVKEIKGVKEADVREYILSTIGSQHHVKRYNIEIIEIIDVEEVK